MKELVPVGRITSKIYLIRGQKVMLGSGSGGTLRRETKVLKQAVKRNISRFPDDFMFEFVEPSFDNLRSQMV
jgi:hypothetical protein